MRCLVMFITAVCLLFLLKLKWPKNKSVYDLACFSLDFFVFLARQLSSVESSVGSQARTGIPFSPEYKVF